ncbi:MAG TPA: Hsp20/alpha crystallin family protein [Vicinamibacterales bacterium]|nr:Hsp20/alpha crystallin family protein [Vicinamibacterales bacterium]
MANVRFDPFRELSALQGGLRGDGGWIPPVDIYETADKALVIKAELPEMKREAIAVTVEHGTLTISGERALPADVKREDYRRVERAYGRFSRRFALPASVDASKVVAEYKDGILNVCLPLREEATPRTVPVAVAS